MPSDIKDFVKQRINEEIDEKYRDFSAKLIPNISNVAGVRLPILRKIAKEIYKKDYQNFINCKNFDYMEETMLKGMVIGLLKENPLTLLPIIKDFVNEIDNWSVCDCFCCGLKFTKNNKELMWNFIQPYFKSKKEYEIRFGCVMLLNYFVEEKYLDRIFCIIENIKTEDYYAKMAIAWLLSICYIKFPQITMNFLRITKINNWIYNKTIQKITESYRITTDTKQILKSLKR